MNLLRFHKRNLVSDDEQKIEVVLVSNSLTGGGAERAINEIANALHLRGINTHLVVLNKSEDDLTKVKCPVHKINRNPQAAILGTLFAYFRFIETIRRLDPRLIVLNCDLPEAFGSFLFFKK